MFRNLLITSYTARTLKTIYVRYCRPQRWFYDIYRNSAVNEIINSFYKRAIIAFRYSLLGRLTDMENAACGQSALINSKVLNCLSNLYSKCSARISGYSNKSKIFYSAIELKSELRFHPAKAGGVIIFTAVLTNIVLSLLLHKEISSFGWGMRWVLLAVGLLGMFCKVGWEELKRTSWLMKHVEKQRLLRPAFGGARNDVQEKG